MTKTTGYAVTINDRTYKEITFARIKELMQAEGVKGKVVLKWVYDGVQINLNGEFYAFYSNESQTMNKDTDAVYVSQLIA